LPGHVVRLFDNRIPILILGGSLGGKKLRDRWENETGQDVAIMLSTNGCCVVAKHRSDWRKKTGGHGQEVG